MAKKEAKAMQGKAMKLSSKKTGGAPKKGQNVANKKDGKGSKPKVGGTKKSIYTAKF